MRINKFIAAATGLSRRAADKAIAQGRVAINQRPVAPGSTVAEGDLVTLDGHEQRLPGQVVLLLNKPVGYVCSRRGQGSRTIYELLPVVYHSLKPVGRLDKDSSGLLLLTNDGRLANELTHPRYAKQKVYEVTLNKPLAGKDKIKIGYGVQLEDGSSHLALKQAGYGGTRWRVTMTEGRNRQIRRTFKFLGYTVTNLQRTEFGNYRLSDLAPGQWEVTPNALKT